MIHGGWRAEEVRRLHAHKTPSNTNKSKSEVSCAFQWTLFISIAVPMSVPAVPHVRVRVRVPDVRSSKVVLPQNLHDIRE